MTTEQKITRKFSATLAQDLPFDFNNLYFEFIKTPASNWSLIEDREGFIWLATASDSFRYDKERQTFETFKAPAGDDSTLMDNQVSALLPSGDGQLWVGTKMALHKFNPVTGKVTQRYKSDDNDPNVPHGELVAAIWEADEGILYAQGARCQQ